MLLLSAIGLYFSRGWISSTFSPYFSGKKVAVVPYEPPDETVISPEQGSTESSEASIYELPAAIDPSSGISSPVAGTIVPSSGSKAPEVKDSVPPNAPAETKLRIEIEAKEQCWLSVDKDGVPAIRKLMEPGETEVFNAVERLRILLGNAGGVEMKINGKPTRSLGDPGKVIRMNIDLENLQQFIDQSTG